MTATASELDQRPRLRPEVVLGPGLVEGAKVVHHLKDPRTGWYFRVGPREFFIVSRLDGRRTLDEIGADYQAAFGRRLGPRHWRQLLGMLAGRRLLAGTEDDRALAELAAAARRESRANRRLLLYRRPLFDPDRLLGRLEPRLRFLFSPALLVPVALDLMLVEVLLGVHARDLVADARRGMSDGPVLAAAVAITWATLALHELAHGLTCKHFGGSAPEIGVIWRFPILAPYCKADDVVLFPRRGQRVATAFAGVFAGLLALLPFALLWMVAPEGSAAGGLAAAVLLIGNGTALANLVPFLQLDGYFMLNHALGMVNLRVESYRYWLRLLGRAAGRAGAGALQPSGDAAAYPAGARRAYLCYGLASVAYGGALLARFLVVWYRLLERRVGPAGAAAVLALLLLAGIAAAARSAARRRAPAARQPPRHLTGGRNGAGTVPIPTPRATEWRKLMTPMAVSARNLSKRFGAVRALDGVDFDVPPGQMVALLGPNGAGKTTTLDILLGFQAPDRGAARLLGMPPRQALDGGHVGAVLQEGELVGGATVGELLRAMAALYRAPARVADVVDQAGLGGVVDRRAERLSGGERRRVAFALALIAGPSLLVLDEPTAGLDVNGRRDFWAAARAHTGSGHTFLFSTHYLEEADENADRIILLNEGRIVADGPAAAIKRCIPTRIIRCTLPGASRDALAGLPGVSGLEVRAAAVIIRSTDTDLTLRGLLATHDQARDVEVSAVPLAEAFHALTADRPPPAAGRHPGDWTALESSGAR